MRRRAQSDLPRFFAVDSVVVESDPALGAAGETLRRVEGHALVVSSIPYWPGWRVSVNRSSGD
jgi:hypothetical protein